MNALDLKDASTVLWSDLIALRRRMLRYLAATVVSPVLYMAAFGLGLGRSIRVDGLSYLDFVIPGIIALTAMNSSFNGSGNRLFLDQIHYRSFDESLMAPVSTFSLLLGKVMIGIFRGMVSSIAFLSVALVICPGIRLSPLLILILAITCTAFSSLGVLAALRARSYEDMVTFGSLVLMPMTFLGGTFFSLSQVPTWLQYGLSLLPLTHSSTCLRAAALGQPIPWESFMVLLGFLVAFFLGGMAALKKISI